MTFSGHSLCVYEAKSECEFLSGQTQAIMEMLGIQNFYKYVVVFIIFLSTQFYLHYFSLKIVQGALTCGFMWIFFMIKDKKLYISKVLKLELNLDLIFGAIISAAKGNQIFDL